MDATFPPYRRQVTQVLFRPWADGNSPRPILHALTIACIMHAGGGDPPISLSPCIADAAMLLSMLLIVVGVRVCIRRALLSEASVYLACFIDGDLLG